jgi:hypothetical protein
VPPQARRAKAFFIDLRLDSHHRTLAPRTRNPTKRTSAALGAGSACQAPVVVEVGRGQ